MENVIKEARYEFSDGNTVLDSVLDIKLSCYEATLRLVLDTNYKPTLTIIVESYSILEKHTDGVIECYTNRGDSYKTLYLESLSGDFKSIGFDNKIPSPGKHYLLDEIYNIDKQFVNMVESSPDLMSYYYAFIEAHVSLSTICLLSS